MRKIFGIENEFTAFNKDGLEIIPPLNNEQLLSSFYKRFVLTLPPESNRFEGFWLKNGGKIYVDSKATEYSSPECETLKELVLVDKAGDSLVTQLFGCLPYSRNDFWLMKRTATSLVKRLQNSRHQQFKTRGSHENYLITERLFRSLERERCSYQRSFLESHLISRQIYAGAGHLQLWDNSRLVFVISPRTHFLSSRVAQLTRGAARSIINLRDRPYVSGSLRSYRRLHLICGDLNRSDWSLYLRFGTTLLVLYYLEIVSMEELENVCRRLSVDDPLEIMKRGSQPFRGNVEKDLFNKLIEIQRIIFEVVSAKKDYLVEIFPEAEVVMDLWVDVLDDLSHLFTDYNLKYSTKLDWLIKKCLFESKMNLPIDCLEAIDEDLRRRLLSLDFLYHCLYPRDFYRDLVSQGAVQERYTMEKALPFCVLPPEGRAKKRVELTTYFKQKTSFLRCFYNLYWEELVLQLGRTQGGSIILEGIAFDETPTVLLKSKIDKLCQQKTE